MVRSVGEIAGEDERERRSERRTLYAECQPMVRSQGKGKKYGMGKPDHLELGSSNISHQGQELMVIALLFFDCERRTGPDGRRQSRADTFGRRLTWLYKKSRKVKFV